MINAEFKQETDKIIAKIQERGVSLENGNVLVAKVKTDRKTAGGLFLSDETTEKEDYHSGFARILALPSNLGISEGDAKLKVGDYVLHSHEARYKPYTPALREVLDHLVDENLVYAVQDSEVILHISQEKV